MIKLRRAKAEDAPAIAGLEAQCFSEPMSEKTVESCLGGSHTVCCIAEENGNFIGYAMMQDVAGECYVDSIAVDEKYRGHGIGTLLTGSLVGVASARDCSFITLEVRESNMAAIKIYSSLGFEKVGLRKGFYSKPTEDGIIMTLRFKEAAE